MSPGPKDSIGFLASFFCDDIIKAVSTVCERVRRIRFSYRCGRDFVDGRIIVGNMSSLGSRDKELVPGSGITKRKLRNPLGEERDGEFIEYKEGIVRYKVARNSSKKPCYVIGTQNDFYAFRSACKEPAFRQGVLSPEALSQMDIVSFLYSGFFEREDFVMQVERPLAIVLGNSLKDSDVSRFLPTLSESNLGAHILDAPVIADSSGNLRSEMGQSGELREFTIMRIPEPGAFGPTWRGNFLQAAQALRTPVPTIVRSSVGRSSRYESFRPRSVSTIGPVSRVQSPHPRPSLDFFKIYTNNPWLLESEGGSFPTSSGVPGTSSFQGDGERQGDSALPFSRGPSTPPLQHFEGISRRTSFNGGRRRASALSSEFDLPDLSFFDRSVEDLTLSPTGQRSTEFASRGKGRF